MIAFARTDRARRPAHAVSAFAAKAHWQAGFLTLLPDIRRQVGVAFRRLPAERRKEAVQEALANALLAYLRLAVLGKTDLAYATPLARYAVRQVCSGREVGCRLNASDLLSPYARRKRGFTVIRLHCPSDDEAAWSERLVADRRSTPAELAASRIDFAAWWRRLPRRKRRIAAMLAGGATTSETARRFKLIAARISQLRREFAADWRQFHGEPEPADAAS